MQFRKKYFTHIGGALLVASAVALVAPRTMHAIAVALVQVTNTRTNPVPNQDVDQPARNSFTATCNVGPQVASISCQPSPMPTGNVKIVIQHASMIVTGDPNLGAPVDLEIDPGSSSGFTQFWLPYVAQRLGVWVADSASTIYVDPATPTLCSMGSVDSQIQHSLACTITGYTVSLP